jgi:hypothetical protein
MSVFWASAGAALVGALVGGFFTAAGAAMQAKASLRAVDNQLLQMFAHEEEQHEKRFLRDAVRQRLLDLSEASNVLYDITTAHFSCDPSAKECTRTSLPLADLRRVRRRLFISDDIYSYRDLPISEECDSGDLSEIIFEFIEQESATSLPARLVDDARGIFEGYPRPRCNYYIVAFYGCDEVEDALNAFRRARDNI